MLSVDLRVDARWVIPVEPENTVLENQAILIKQDKIVAICDQSDADVRYQADKKEDKNHHIIIPGLINCHTHAAMNLLRGLADDLALMQWLQGHIWPAEQQWVSASFVETGTQLAIAELLRSGVTCFNDMYFFPDVVAKTAQSAGIRTQVGAVVFDFPCAWGNGPDAYFEKAVALAETVATLPLASLNIGPHAPYTVSDENLQRTRAFADKYHCPINIHLHETAQEVTDSLKQYQKTPIQRLVDLGFLQKDVIAVHMTALENEQDLQHILDIKPQIVTCPESNLKLASGLCPVAKLSKLGLNVAIGTDGAASNNNLDMLGEMQTTALLAKSVAKDPTVCSAFDTLKMATLNGAKAMGLDHAIGSLLPGKQADFTAIDCSTIETMPLYHPVSQLVYAITREQVTDVWVAGAHVLKARTPTQLDLASLAAECQAWQQKLKEHS